MDDKLKEFTQYLKGIANKVNKEPPQLIPAEENYQIAKRVGKEPREALTVFFLAHNKQPNFTDYQHETVSQLLNLSLMETEGLYVCQNIWHNLNVFESWEVFEKTVCVLNQRHMNVYATQDITPSELCWAVKCIRTIDDQCLFNDQVIGYMAAVLHMNGFVNVPESIKDEESFMGLNVQFYLNKSNNHHEHHDPETESEIFQSINRYVEYRKEKLLKELEENGLDKLQL